MTALQFREWRTRIGLTLTGAGLALGMSRRMVASYQSGEWPVPKPIAKLCGYLERDLRRTLVQE